MLLVLVITIAGSRDLAAQEQPLTVKINGFTSADLSHAQAVVTVLDSSGHPVSGLAKDSFTAQLNDATIPTVRLTQGVESSLPLTVVLALDASAGMQGAPLDQAKLGAEGFVDGLGPQDSVAVFAFADTVTLVQPFTVDHAAARAAIDALRAGGASQLYQATLQSVLQASASADTGRRAVVLLSSTPDAGNGSAEEALFAPQALGVPVFGIGLGSKTDDDYLRRLADASGGQFTQAGSPEGLAPLYQSVGELLRDQYVLTLDASGAPGGTPSPATLSITAVAGESSGSDQRLVCRQRLCVALDVSASEQLAAPRTISANVVSSNPVTSVTFWVDGQPAATVKTSPYQFTLDPKQYPEGKHTLAAEAASGSDTVRTQDLEVQLGAKASSGRSGVIVAAAVIAVVLAGILLLAYVVLRRRKRGEGPKPVAPPDTPKTRPMLEARTGLRLLKPTEGHAPPQPASEPGAELGRLYVTNGPIAGEAFAIGSTPVSIGSGHRCTIRLPRELDAGGEIAPEFARIWVRDDHLVVHELRRLTVAGPVGGRWEMLEDGDVFSIGPFSFRFELGIKTEQEQPPAPLPDIFRDRTTTAATADSAASEQPLATEPQSGQLESAPEEPPQAAAAP